MEAIGQIGTVIVQINDIQNTIASAVEEQSATTNEISRNLAEAAQGRQEITKNISGVAEAARSTTAGAGDTQKSAQSLERMAAELQELVSQFKYEGEAKTRSANRVANPSVRKSNGRYVEAASAQEEVGCPLILLGRGWRVATNRPRPVLKLPGNKAESKVRKNQEETCARSWWMTRRQCDRSCG